AGVIHADGGGALIVGGGGVDEKFGVADRSAAGVESPRVDSAAAAVLIVPAGPGDDERAGGVHGDGGLVLAVAGAGVGLHIARPAARPPPAPADRPPPSRSR